MANRMTDKQCDAILRDYVGGGHLDRNDVDIMRAELHKALNEIDRLRATPSTPDPNDPFTLSEDGFVKWMRARSGVAVGLTFGDDELGRAVAETIWKMNYWRERCWRAEHPGE